VFGNKECVQMTVEEERLKLTDFVQNNQFELNSYLNYLFNYYDSIVLRLLDSDSDTKLTNN
jgi:hypothetical protein